MPSLSWARSFLDFVKNSSRSYVSIKLSCSRSFIRLSYCLMFSGSATFFLTLALRESFWSSAAFSLLYESASA